MGLSRWNGAPAASRLPLVLALVAWAGLAQCHSHSGPGCLELERKLHVETEAIENMYGNDLLTRSLAVMGSEERYAVLLQRLLAGSPLRIAAVGGSITEGRGLANPEKETYVHALAGLLQKVFPEQVSPDSVLRAFVGSSGSAVLRFCAQSLFDVLSHGDQARGWAAAKDADIFILDLAADDMVFLQPTMEPPTNGGGHLHVESLVRPLLELPQSPLIILLNFGLHNKEHPWESNFLDSAEQYLNTVAAYYEFPALSMWRAYFPLLEAQAPEVPSSALLTNDTDMAQMFKLMGAALKEHSMVFTDLFLDGMHPSKAGHSMAGSLIAHHLLSSFARLLGRADLLDTPADVVHPLLPACPGRNLCNECTKGKGAAALIPRGSLWTNQWLLPPMESKASPYPLCLMAAQLNVTAMGERAFDQGAQLNAEGHFVESGAAWHLAPCGGSKCWTAKQPGMPLHLNVDIPGTGKDCTKVEGLNVIYSIMPENMGLEKTTASLFIDGQPQSPISVHVPGNKLVHWFVDASKEVGARATNFCKPFKLTIQPSTPFNLLAVVAD